MINDDDDNNNVFKYEYETMFLQFILKISFLNANVLNKSLLLFSRSSTVKILESLRRKLLSCSFLSVLPRVSLA